MEDSVADVAALPDTLGLREFAKRQGWKPSYITQLKASGRLVLTDDGRRVRVAESLQLIAETRDPAKVGVQARHAAARAAADSSAAETGSDDEAADAPALRADDPHSQRRAKAMADKEEALARKALREEQVEIGQLLPRKDVEASIADAAAMLRTKLQNLSHSLALVDNRDRPIVAEGIEEILAEFARKFGSIGKLA
jgi:hypothetical protein